MGFVRSITIMHYTIYFVVMIYFDFYLYNFVITLFALSDIKETSKNSRSNAFQKHPTFGFTKHEIAGDFFSYFLEKKMVLKKVL